MLSTDFLQDYDIDLDCPGQEIRLYQASGSCERPKVLLLPPLYTVALIRDDDDKRPRIQVEIEGHSVIALIDTGAGTTSIYRRAALRSGRAETNLSADAAATTYGIGPKPVTVAHHVFGALTIGNLTLNTRASTSSTTPKTTTPKSSSAATSKRNSMSGSRTRPTPSSSNIPRNHPLQFRSVRLPTAHTQPSLSLLTFI